MNKDRFKNILALSLVITSALSACGPVGGGVNDRNDALIQAENARKNKPTQVFNIQTVEAILTPSATPTEPFITIPTYQP